VLGWVAVGAVHGADRLGVLRVRHCVDELVKFGAILAQGGSPSWLAGIYLAKIGPLRVRFSLWKGFFSTSRTWKPQRCKIRARSGPNLAKKDCCEAGPEPVRAMDGAVPYPDQHNDATSYCLASSLFGNFRRTTRPKIASGPHCMFETCTSAPRSEIRPRSGLNVAKEEEREPRWRASPRQEGALLLPNWSCG